MIDICLHDCLSTYLLDGSEIEKFYAVETCSPLLKTNFKLKISTFSKIVLWNHSFQNPSLLKHLFSFIYDGNRLQCFSESETGVFK